LELAQEHQYRDYIKLIGGNFEPSKVTPNSFDLLIAADGASSKVRQFWKKEFKTISHGSEYAIGVGYTIPDDKSLPFVNNTQSMNVILTLGQTRYLINSSKGRRGFLNIRVSKDEWREVPQQPEKRENGNKFTCEKDNTRLWDVIKQGFKFYSIPLEYVHTLNPINIDIVTAKNFYTNIKDMKQPLDGRTPPMVLLIGDAAMRVHFWPGRGLNSGIKSAVGLARRLFHTMIDKRRRFGIRPADIAKWVGFMHALSVREQATRSEIMLKEVPSIDDVLQCKNTPTFKQEFISKLIGLRQIYKGTEPMLDELLKQSCDKMDEDTLKIMNASGEWPITQMRGEEQNPRDYCPNPLVPSRAKK